MSATCRALLCFALASCAVSCSNSSDTPQSLPESDAGLDVQAEIALDSGGEEYESHPLRITVYEGSQYAELRGYVRAPIAGATVAVDHPAFGRVELVTDSDGVAVLPDVPVCPGFFVLSAHKPGYSIITERVHCDPSKASWYAGLTITPVSPPSLLTVSGKAKGMDAASHFLVPLGDLWVGTAA